MDTYEISLSKAVVTGVVTVLVLIIVLLGYFLRRQQQYREWLKQLAATEVNRLEEERSRLSMDLHDELRPLLTAARLQLMLIKKEEGSAAGHAATALGYVDTLNQRLYEIACNLGSRVLERKGLKGALEDLAQTTLGQGLPTKLRYRLETGLPAEVQMHLYRMVQELLQNAVKHSGASAVQVVLDEGAKLIRLVYQDNGAGFVYGEEQGGMGLHHLRRRIALLDGTMVCRTEPGEGTYYVFEVPKPKLHGTKRNRHSPGDR